jgi:hypothetical protein
LFGVNPWRLQAWSGHKRIDETMLCVHVAEAHPRQPPKHVQKAARRIADPDARVLGMLSARIRRRKRRRTDAPWQRRGKTQPPDLEVLNAS